MSQIPGRVGEQIWNLVFVSQFVQGVVVLAMVLIF